MNGAESFRKKRTFINIDTILLQSLAESTSAVVLVVLFYGSCRFV